MVFSKTFSLLREFVLSKTFPYKLSPINFPVSLINFPLINFPL